MKFKNTILKNVFRIGIFGVLFFPACGGKRNMTFETVQKGNDLESIPQISVEVFFQFWIKNRKHVKIDVNVRKLFEEERFAYFGKKKFGIFGSESSFFKVERQTLQKEFPGYENFYASDLETYFWNEVLPQNDKQLWISNTTADKSKCGLKYRYFLKDRKITVDPHWDVRNCSELVSLSTRRYRFIYDLKNKRIEEEKVGKKQQNLSDSE
ncbi:hypothetical protein EHQ12_16005 [Leptospira gomenensis]|uniref:Lipoprotein n=1 Tax=Leptospira gomenensis TaxID=2484974 RepID=A0A5F1YCS2_9LEPT|nr:hypothetical protein [Leptospira gomenensis]TGK35100.1 hypothetical protein EHQ12_16005 [Leptospira gomenensis]TGK35223.1 hypothetical protein EHQ17_07220 [Leptospira gomenensis]TGK41084.1 hypothetical protein EHQ07_16980 [Leptospira gomenensis]TGK61314.1 hypothetical protein EHQ13_09660 [Leptospira gomenensis]